MATVSPAVEACPACGAVLTTPLLCERCGTLLSPPAPPTPFAVFGLAPAWSIDVAATRKRLLALSRVLHPDFHSNADAATRRRAEDNTAALNAAYQLLADDFRRADWLVRSLGGPAEDQERAMPPAFLQAVLEWSEAIEDARSSPPSSPERAQLEPLAAELREARSEGMRRVGSLLTPLPVPGSPPLRVVRQELNALRYLDRALREIGELSLASTA